MGVVADAVGADGKVLTTTGVATVELAVDPPKLSLDTAARGQQVFFQV